MSVQSAAMTGVTPVIAGKRRGLPVDVLKALTGMVAGFVATLPDGIRNAILVATMLTILDTITGMWLAARKGEFSSNVMRAQLAPKLLQFATIAVFGGGASLVSGISAPFGAAVGIIIGIEMASNLENLHRLEQCGGAPLGPFRPLIERLGRYFAVPDLPVPPTVTTVTATATVTTEETKP
jgi:hypothetical protein